MIHSNLAGESDELILNFGPDGRRRIDDFKMPDVLHRDELDVLSGFLFLFCVSLANFVGDVFIGCPVNEDLLRTNVEFRGRRLTIVIVGICWRSAEKTCNSVTAQMKFPCATQIQHAGQREHTGNCRFMCGETQGKLASGRVSGNAEAVAVERRKFILAIEKEVKSGAKVFKCSWPSTTWITDAPVLNIVSGDSSEFESVA